MGEFQLLKDFNADVIYRRQFLDTSTPFPELPGDCTILLQGGGDFGDVWRGIQDVRLDVISKYKDHTIIVFPQTVHYLEESLMVADADRMSACGDLHICARDEKSYNFLKSNFKNHIHLIPDMAMCIDRSMLLKYRDNNEPSMDLYLKRVDKEYNGALENALMRDDLDVRDWPTFGVRLRSVKMNMMILGLTGALDRRGLSVLSRLAQRASTKLITSYGYDRMARIGVKFLSDYKDVTVTRLHAAILSVLIDKPVKLMDNSYHKNLNFYNTWFRNLDTMTMIQ